MGRQPRKAVYSLSAVEQMQFTPRGEASSARSTWYFLRVWRPFLFIHPQNSARDGVCHAQNSRTLMLCVKLREKVVPTFSQLVRNGREKIRDENEVAGAGRLS